MYTRKELLEPQPLLLGQSSDNHRSTVKSAIYKSQDRNQQRISSVNKKDLNQRIANELKKIGPNQLGRKSSHPALLKRQKHMHTTSSGEYIQEYGENAGPNPEITEKLDELTQKINLIEYRQRKMQSKSRYSLKKQQTPIMKQSKTIKISGNDYNTHDVSRVVIKELKTVKDEILELKMMMGGVRYSNDNIAEIMRSNRNGSDRPSEMSTMVNSNVKMKNEKVKHKVMEQQTEEDQQEKRTIFYNPKAQKLNQKNITLGQGNLLEEHQLQLKAMNSATLQHKGKPQLSSNISLIPRGLSTKQFRVSRTASRKQIPSPYVVQQPRKQAISQMSKYAVRKTPDLISAIEDNFQKDDFQKKTVILPKLPEGFNPVLNSEELMNLAKELMISFNVESDWSQPINIKKYRNCVFFNHLNTNVLWHYDNKFYIGGWSDEGQGSKEGYGVQSIPQKYMYEGQFYKGKRHGFGAMSSFNGEYYKGSWINGYRHGKGRLQEPSGSIFDGNWVQGRKQGFGKLKLSNKQYFEGLFKDNQKQGMGKQLFRNGDAYQGDYVGGKFDGMGIYRWANGASYDGQFKNGKRQGRGTWVSNNTKKPDIYQGEYDNDKKSGKGKYTWSNGSMYLGSFHNDLKSGEGTIYYNNGKVLYGIWDQDKMVKRLYTQKPKVKKIKK